MKSTTKKILIAIITTLCALCMAFAFVACDAQSTTSGTEQTESADGTPPTPPSGGEQGGFPGGQGGPNGQQGGFPGGQGSNVSRESVTTEGVQKTELLEEIYNFDYTLDFDETLNYTTLEDVVEIDLSTLEGDYEITESGNYVFTGETEYRIVLNSAKKGDEIHIWLVNATLDSVTTTGKKAAATVITLVGDNEMTGVKSDLDDDAKGTLYVKGDMLINGNGNLTIASGDDKNGVHCTGTLQIEDATLTINAGKHGVRGNDNIVILNATLNVTAGTDGIQTDNEVDYEDLADEYDVTFGYVYIEDGDITIESGDDGISATTLLYIKSGEINITTNGGAPSRITETSSDNADGKGLKAGSIQYAVSDELLEEELAKGDRVDTGDDDSEGVSVVELTTLDYYAIVIEGGEITINANDDAIHSDGNLFITGGNLNITSGDDGVHAEEVLKITDGTILINNCYEGIEAAKLEIAGGDVTLTAQDDGLNAADGSQTQMGVANTNCYIIISGGVVRVNASGDGVDSNNTIYVSGGELYVDGPTNNGNSALDTEAGVLIDGGTVVAVGSSGMAETPSANGAQNVIVYQGSNVQAGTTISVKNASGETVLEYTTAKSAQSVILSTIAFKTGETYTVYVGGTSVGEATLSSTVTYLGTQGMGGMGGFGGQGGPQGAPDGNFGGQAHDGSTPPEMPQDNQ